MKQLLVLFFCVGSIAASSQDTIMPSVLTHETLINTVGSNSIVVNIVLDFPTGILEDYAIDDETFDDLNAGVTAHLASNKYENLITQEEEISLSVSRRKIIFTIVNTNDQLINMLNDSLADIYIETNKDIVFLAIKGTDESSLRPLKLTRDQIEKNTRSGIFLTPSMARELISAKGGEVFMTQNQFNFGVIPAGEASSGKTEYTATFKYRTGYSFIKNAPIFLSAEGLVGTNIHDSLNYISVYPVNYNFLKGSHLLIGQLGIEGDQVFSNYRISGNFFWTGIIPNLVDFTFGEDRLRLKPVIKTGLKFYQEMKNNRPLTLNENKFSNQVYGEFYYYIPIQKTFSLILEGTAFYDFNPKVNPGEKLMFNYSAVLGIDIPKTDFKTIFKYAKGENGISYKANTYFMIGLMMDMFGLD